MAKTLKEEVLLMDFTNKVKSYLKEKEKERAEIYTADYLICPECGFEDDEDAFDGNECPECGEDIENIDSFETTRWDCPYCGETNEADSFLKKNQEVTCEHCGKKSIIS
jgi:DNA-directed RNA polymerase subunit RPC12/RpoP